MFPPTQLQSTARPAAGRGVPGACRRQPRSRDLHRLRPRPLRENPLNVVGTVPAWGAMRCRSAGATSSRALRNGRCRPGSWNSGETRRRGRAVRETVEGGRRADRARACTRCSTWSASARSTCSTAKPSTPSSRPALRGDDRRRCFGERVPWDQLAFGPCATLRRYFRRPAPRRVPGCTAPPAEMFAGYRGLLRRSAPYHGPVMPSMPQAQRLASFGARLA